jgi:hypothetical protein
MAQLNLAVNVDQRELNQLNSNVRSFGNNFNNILGNVSGQLGNITNQIGNVAEEFRNLGTSGTLAGGLIGAGIAVAVGSLGLLLNGINNAQIEEQKFINTFGEFNKKMLIQANVISRVHTIAQEDIMKTANSFSKAAAISVNDAFVLIKQGLDRGANANGEFLDSIKEYTPLFMEMGLSAKQATALLTGMGKSGVFSDKAADSVKEASLKLRDFSKATEESLIPLGKQAVELIKTKVGSGKVFEAIQDISKAMSTTSLSVQQKSKIMADVFGSAGEDASMKWIEGIQNVNLELDSYKNNLTDATKAQESLLISWEVLKSQIFDTNGVLGKFLTDTKLGLADIFRNISIFLEADFLTKLKMLLNDIIGLLIAPIEYGLIKPLQALVGLLAKLPGTGGFVDTFKAIKDFNLTKTLQLDLSKDKGYQDAVKKVTDLSNLEKLNNAGLNNVTKTVNDVNGLGTPKSTPLTGETKLSGSGVKSITINIENVIDTVQISQNENPMIIKDMVTKALLTAIADASSSA